MSEVWEDITGSREKPQKRLVEAKVKSGSKYVHESEETTAKRRAKCLEAIFRTFEDPKFNSDGSLTVMKAGKKFDFWPASDSFFSYSIQKYGVGIQRVCELLEKFAEE